MSNSYSRSLICFVMLHGRLMKTSSVSLNCTRIWDRITFMGSGQKFLSSRTVRSSYLSEKNQRINLSMSAILSSYRKYNHHHDIFGQTTVNYSFNLLQFKESITLKKNEERKHWMEFPDILQKKYKSYCSSFCSKLTILLILSSDKQFSCKTCFNHMSLISICTDLQDSYSPFIVLQTIPPPAVANNTKNKYF